MGSFISNPCLGECDSSQLPIETIGEEQSNLNLIDENNLIRAVKVIQSAYKAYKFQSSLKTFLDLKKNKLLQLLITKHKAVMLNKQEFLEKLSPTVATILRTLPPITFSHTSAESDNILPPLFFNKDSSFCYKGSWNENLKFEGIGSLIDCKGELLKGLWVDGNLQGSGVSIKDDGSYYFGNFHNSLYEGSGQLTDNFGNVYSGEWIQGKKQGKGRETLIDGSVIFGEFCNNFLKQGTLIDVSKNQITGFFEQDMLREGSIKFASGAKFQGTLQAGKFQGNGIFRFRSGRKYVGSYNEGMKEGFGEYTFKNGRYRGEWLLGQFNGKGKLTYGNESLKGVWKFGSLVSVIESTGDRIKSSKINVEQEEEIKFGCIRNLMLSTGYTDDFSFEKGNGSFFSNSVAKPFWRSNKIEETTVSFKRPHRKTKSFFDRHKGFELSSSHMFLLDKFDDDDFEAVEGKLEIMPLSKKVSIVEQLMSFRDNHQEVPVNGLEHSPVLRYFFN